METNHAESVSQLSRWYKPVVKRKNKSIMVPVLTPAKKRTVLPALLSGTLCGLLMYVFCAVFAIVIKDLGDVTPEYVALGIEVQLLTACLSGFAFTHFSSLPIVIGGPDITPTVMLTIIASDISSSIGYADPARRSRQLVPTLMFAVGLSSFSVGVAFFCLGRFHATKIVQFFPAPVLMGFLACVGYKVVAEAVFVATDLHFEIEYFDQLFGDWFYLKLILASLPVGVMMYLAKRWHVAQMSVVLPVGIGVCVGLFYLCLFLSGWSLKQARDAGWLFKEEFDRGTWTAVWKEGWPELSKVDWPAIGYAVPDILALVLIVVMDHLLKIAGTEKTLRLVMDYDDEMKLAGLVNLVLAPTCFTAPTYGQMKFNLLNYAIIENVSDRSAGYVCSLFVGVLWATGLPLINYLPRFVLASLVLFAGLGFLVENIWDSRSRLSKLEFLAVLLVLLISLLTSLLVAVLGGVVLSTFIFAYQYSRRAYFKGVFNHSSFRSKVARVLSHSEKLEQLKDLTLVIQLQGLLFFGSASRIATLIGDRLSHDAELELPEYARLRFVIIDFENVTACDLAAASIFDRLRRLAQIERFTFVYANLTEKLRSKFESVDAIDPLPIPIFATAAAGDDVSPPFTLLHAAVEAQVKEWDAGTRCVLEFPNADLAMEWCEDQVLHYCNVIRSKWLFLTAVRKAHAIAVYKSLKSPFDQFFHKDTPLWRFCQHQVFPPGHVLCRTGEMSPVLYLLQSGKVSSYIGLGADLTRVLSSTEGAFSLGIMRIPSFETVICDSEAHMVSINAAQWKALEAQHPLLALRLQGAVLSWVIATRGLQERAGMSAGLLRNDMSCRNGGLAGGGGVAVDETRLPNLVLDTGDDSSLSLPPASSDLTPLLTKIGQGVQGLAVRLQQQQMLAVRAKAKSSDWTSLALSELCVPTQKWGGTEEEGRRAALPAPVTEEEGRRAALPTPVSSCGILERLVKMAHTTDTATIGVSNSASVFKAEHKALFTGNANGGKGNLLTSAALEAHNQAEGWRAVAVDDDRSSSSCSSYSSWSTSSSLCNQCGFLSCECGEAKVQVFPDPHRRHHHGHHTLHRPVKHWPLPDNVQSDQQRLPPSNAVIGLPSNKQQMGDDDVLFRVDSQGNNVLIANSTDPISSFACSPSPSPLCIGGGGGIVRVSSGPVHRHHHYTSKPEHHHPRRYSDVVANVPLAPAAPSLPSSSDHASAPPHPPRQAITVFDLRSSRVFGSLYTLSARQREEFCETFELHAISQGRCASSVGATRARAQSWHPSLPSLYNSARIPVRFLRHILMDLGYYENKQEFEKLLEKAHFVKTTTADIHRHNRRTSVAAASRLAGGSSSSDARNSNESNTAGPSTHSHNVQHVWKLGLELEQFLYFMTKVTRVTLSAAQLNVYAQIFGFFDAGSTGSLSQTQVERLLSSVFGARMSEEDRQELLEQWEISEHGELNYQEFLSMISCGLKRTELELGLNKAAEYLSHRGTVQQQKMKIANKGQPHPQLLATEDQIGVQGNGNEAEGRITVQSLRAAVKRITGKSLPVEEVEEMMYVASPAAGGPVGRRHLSVAAFTELIEIVFEPGWLCLWNYQKMQPQKIIHDLIVEAEFDELDNVAEQEAVELARKGLLK